MAEKLPENDAQLHKHYYRAGYEEGFLADPELEEVDIKSSEAAMDGEIRDLI